MSNIKQINDHVQGMSNVEKLTDRERSGIKFILDESYAVEVYYDNFTSVYVVAYNSSFDYNGNPQLGCWEYANCETQEDVIKELSDTSHWCYTTESED